MKILNKTIETVDVSNQGMSEAAPAAETALECSSAGDRRFSALYARVTVDGVEDTIENHYQKAKRLKDGSVAGKGRAFDYLLVKGLKCRPENATAYYALLWRSYLSKHKELVAYAKGFDNFTDKFRGAAVNSQADFIRVFVKEGPVAYEEKYGAMAFLEKVNSKVSVPEAAPAARDSSDRMLRVAFSGTRRLPWGYKEPGKDQDLVVLMRDVLDTLKVRAAHKPSVNKDLFTLEDLLGDRSEEFRGKFFGVVTLNGGAVGVDQLSIQASRQAGIPYEMWVPCVGQDRMWPEPVRKNYQQYLMGAAALPLENSLAKETYSPINMIRRNHLMAESCDLAIICWDGQSAGTRDFMTHMKKLGKPYILIDLIRMQIIDGIKE